MKKWILSAAVYLIVVVGVYYVYTSMAEPSIENPEHSNTEQHNE